MTTSKQEKAPIADPANTTGNPSINSGLPVRLALLLRPPKKSRERFFQDASQGWARPWIFTGKSVGLLVRHRACNVCRPSGFGDWFRHASRGRTESGRAEAVSRIRITVP